MAKFRVGDKVVMSHSYLDTFNDPEWQEEAGRKRYRVQQVRYFRDRKW